MSCKSSAHAFASASVSSAALSARLPSASPPSPASRQAGWWRKVRNFAAAVSGTLLLASFGGAIAAEPTEITGELDVIITDSREDATHDHASDAGHSKLEYFVRNADGRKWHQIEFKDTPPGHLRSGQRVKVRGQVEGRKLQVESLDQQEGEPSTTVVEPLGAAGQVVGERRAVVLMVSLSNVATAMTRDQVVAQMFTNPRSVDGLYREASLGQVSFPADSNGDGQADVYGPFTIAYDNSTCDYYTWATAAEAAAQAAGVDFSRYQHRVFVLPFGSALPQCMWAGMANVGCDGTFCRAWIASNLGMTFSHELGHNLNLAHAGNDPENDGAINDAYADRSDPMGRSSSSWYLFNAAHLDQLGWYAGIPGAITTLSSGGSYRLAAIGTYPTGGATPTALKIARMTTGDFYYLSYRQPSGNYNQLTTDYTKGINIHRYQGSDYGYTSHVKTLIDGETFTDSANGISVTQVSQGGGYATVQVSLAAAACTPATPTVAVSPTSLTVRRGAAASFSVVASNRDGASCAGTLFTLSSSGVPTGSLSPSSLLLAAGQSGSSTLAVNTNVADGSHVLAVYAADNDGAAPQHSASGQGSTRVIVDGTPPTTPSSLVAKVDTLRQVALTWRASTDALSGVAGYTVYRNGLVLANTTSASHTDATAVVGTTYSYTVSALDGAGNVSLPSSKVSVTVSSTTKRK